MACFPTGEAAADDAILLKAGLESAIWRKMPASFCFAAASESLEEAQLATADLNL